MSTPHKSECPAATGQAQEANQKTDGAIITLSDDDRKRFSTLRSRYALLGHELHRVGDGSYYATRWGVMRYLASLRDVEAFLHQIGGDHEL